MRLLRFSGFALALLAVLAIAAPYSTSDDLPNPAAHIETIPAGSLVIPMDNTLQALVAPFNLKAYGLVNRLLQNGVPVKWAIRAGKAKDGVDFTATAQRIAPSATGAASLNFAGGPFIVHRDFAQLARTYITAFGNNVAVYETTAAASMDIRYDVAFKPSVAVNTDNASIHTTLFDFAAIPNYAVINGTSLLAGSCFTIFTEPHTNDITGIANVKAYVQSGGNFLAECLAVETYENDPAGRFQTSNGIVTNNVNNTLAYPNADLAYSQFVGVLDPAPGGSHQDWKLATGSVFQNNGYLNLDNIGASPASYAATTAKLRTGPGGMVFYLGGHSYGAGGSDITSINGQRMILNALFIPNNRPACTFDFAGSIRTISGAVSEDVNGDGNLSDGLLRPGVNLRLYADMNDNGLVDAGDTFLAAGTTDASGAYSFQASTIASGTRYLVAVDSRSVTASAGFNAGFTQGDVWAEQTYGDNSATAALDLSPRFAGRTNNASDNYNAASPVPASNSYEHLARINATSGNVTGVNFGFSFNVVTGIRGSGTVDDDLTANRTVQGSFRQFMQNANALAGANAMRFVPALAANAGAWWHIDITAALPAITDANTTIDGQAYSSADGTTVLNTNAGAIGAGGTVGADALALPAVNKPELEIQNLRSTAIVNLGLDVQAGATAIRRIALYGFGSAANSDTSANIRIGAGGGSALIEESIIGSGAGAFADPGAATRSAGDDVRIAGGTTAKIQNSAIGFSAGNGIALSASASGAQILSNEIRGNGLANATLAGISIGSGTSGTVQGNLFSANNGAGAEVANGTGASTIVNNTFTGNGVGAGGVKCGVRLLGNSITIDRNIITANAGAGVLVGASGAQNIVTKNSIFLNGGIGIDLLGAAENQTSGTAPFVTPNDNGDGDSGGNGLLNFAVISTAALSGSDLVIQGFARPGSVIELFLADPDASNFGEGKTFLLTLTEGSASDTDATTGTYTNPVNSLNQGADTTNRFTFTMPLPAGVTLGSILTATATLAGATSEFSGDVIVAAARQFDISGYVYGDGNLNLQRDEGENGTGLTLYVKVVNSATPAGPAAAAALADPTTGAFTLPPVPSGVYALILDDNNTLSDVTPALPAGWTGTEMPDGTRTPVAFNNVPIRNQNFGLYHGILISGRVFNDNGLTAGVPNDGILNGGETGVAGAMLKLTDAAGATLYATATTNANGDYALALPSGVAAGTQLKIVETNASGFVSTGASAGNTAGAYDRASDTIAFSLAANTAYAGVNFGDVAPNTLSTDGQQAGLPGTTIFYPHTFTAESAGSVAFSTTSTPAPALPGWTSTLYRDSDGNGQLDANEPAVAGPITVTAGETVALIVKEFIPTNAPLGAKDQTRLTANFTYTGAAPVLSLTLTRQDVTTVGNPTTAGLTLNKTVDKPSALPGDTITYTVTYTNTSSDILRNVIIYDSTPAFTKFTSGSNGPLPLDLTGVALTAPAVGARGAMRWNFAGTLRPGGTGTIAFQVTLDQ